MRSLGKSSCCLRKLQFRLPPPTLTLLPHTPSPHTLLPLTPTAPPLRPPPPPSGPLQHYPSASLRRSLPLWPTAGAKLNLTLILVLHTCATYALSQGEDKAMASPVDYLAAVSWLPLLRPLHRVPARRGSSASGAASALAGFVPS